MLLKGIPVSGGYGIGRIVIYQEYIPDIKKVKIGKENIERELANFKEALKKSAEDLLHLKETIGERLGSDFSGFLDVQLHVINDKEFIEKVVNTIKEGFSAEYSLKRAVDEILLPLRAQGTQFFKERMIDIYDVTHRILKNLHGLPPFTIVDIPEDSIIVAKNLPPSEAILLTPEKVKGIALQAAGKTAHVTIIAKSLEIPAVAGIKDLLNKTEEGKTGIVDGERGIFIINPTKQKIEYYTKQIENLRIRRLKLIEKHAPPITKDGKRIDVSANIELLSEIYSVKKYEAEGIGLFRTEYLFLAKRRVPTEEEQFYIYKEAAERLKPMPVIIRTFDFGGDKIVPDYTEPNPFLGWRAVRFCLDNLDFFNSQLRAIIRASAYGNVKLMFPMISSIEEIRKIKIILKNIYKELDDKEIPYDKDMEIGIMVEVPSVALLAEKFTKYVNFFSIGSNDLTQYTLAVDRNNERISSLFDHFHPAVLRLIKRTIGAAHQGHIWVGVCGEIASDPLGIALLVGFGVDELSMIPCMVPEAKVIIQGLEYEKVKKIVHKVVEFSTPLEVTRYLRRELSKSFPDLAPLFKKGNISCIL